MRKTTLATLIALACFMMPLAHAQVSAAPASEGAAAVDADLVAAGQALTADLHAGDTAAVWARFDDTMRAAMDEAALAAFRDQLLAQLGEEASVASEEIVDVQGAKAYVRISTWSKAPGRVMTQWVFGPDRRVAGFFIRPAEPPKEAASPHLDRDTVAHLRLPFEGEWFVAWGGRTIEQNYHAATPGQRFAYDFLQRVDGSTHTGDGTELAQYHCWNEPILAPADGTVVTAVDGLPDQAIGTTNREQPAGNHVILDLGHGEYALLAHFREGSVAVQAGQAVAAGDEIGRCGNSGNTSEPHLHFHLQDSSVFREGLGLPAFFNGYVADGAPVARGEPLRGQVIRAASDAD